MVETIDHRFGKQVFAGHRLQRRPVMASAPAFGTTAASSSAIFSRNWFSS